MKLCAACCEELPKESFSKKQWQLKQHQRRCKDCISTNQVVQLKPPPKNESAEVERPSTPGNEDLPHCYICLEEGPDELDKPLMRDCSCRGKTTGFVHLSCIVEYAKQRSQDWNGRCTDDELMEPWAVCPNCEQRYQGELALDLANQCVAYMEGQYPGDQLKHLEALYLKLRAITEKDGKGDVRRTANEIFVVIKEMKDKMPLLPKSALFIVAMAYNQLGRVILREDTHESVRLAVAYFEKTLDIGRDVCDAGFITSVESHIVIAKARYEGRSSESNEERLARSQAIYEERVKSRGQGASDTIVSGMNLAITLLFACHGIETERLSTKLAATCRLVHGPDHRITQSAESQFQRFKIRTVGIKNRDGYFQALRYKGDGKQCVIQGPIAEPRNIQNEKTFTVTSADIELALGTPVVCHGLDTTPHLNGKIGDLRSLDEETGFAEVHFEDRDLEPCFVKRDNFRILFELPAQ